MEHQTQTQNPPNKALTILRKSTHTFLKRLNLFSSTPTLLSLPFSLSLLLHLSSTTASSALHRRLHTLLLAAGLPHSQFLLLKLSQTLSSVLFSLPFSLSFLLLSQSSALQTLKTQSFNSPPIRSLQTLKIQSFDSPPIRFLPLLLTKFAALFVLLAVNSASLSLLALAAPLPTLALLPAALLYSILLAKSIVVCSLAVVVSAESNIAGLSAVIRAFELVDGKYLTALAVAIPGNLMMAAVEVVFRCRVYGVGGERWVWGVAAEMVLIAYLYSLIIVWDTIVWGIFYQSCKEECEIGIGDDLVEEYASDLLKLRAIEEGFSC